MNKTKIHFALNEAGATYQATKSALRQAEEASSDAAKAQAAWDRAMSLSSKEDSDPERQAKVLRAQYESKIAVDTLREASKRMARALAAAIRAEKKGRS